MGRSANRLAKRHGYWRASVGEEKIYFEVLKVDGWPAVACIRHFSPKVIRFIRTFDARGMNVDDAFSLEGGDFAFKPFSFEIRDIPDRRKVL